MLNAETDVLSDKLSNIFILAEAVDDVLDIGLIPGLYSVQPAALNNPLQTYGMEIFISNKNKKWIFVIFIPTGLQEIYFNFYNGYDDGTTGWNGWRKVVPLSV